VKAEAAKLTHKIWYGTQVLSCGIFDEPLRCEQAHELAPRLGQYDDQINGRL